MQVTGSSEGIAPESVHSPATNPAQVGFVLTDSSLNLLAYNPEAAQILTYPNLPAEAARLDAVLGRKIRDHLLLRRPPSGRPAFVREFTSGRRSYVCRILEFNSHVRGLDHGAVGLLFERKSSGSIALNAVAQRYGLTHRECQAVQYLLKGLTSKEIAGQMGISFNTVKCFLRLVMIKMGVTTRSAIVGRILAGLIVMLDGE